MGIKTNIYENKSTNILNIYLPNTTNITTDTLNKLLPYLTPSAFIGGDFNAHNSLWGADNKTNPRGRLIEKWLEDNNLITLNNGEPTFHRLTSSTYTTIDLSIITPDLINDATFYVHEDSWGSDHFPIFTTFRNSTLNDENPSTQPHKSWNFEKANWELFRNLCKQHINKDIEDDDINIYNKNLTEAQLKKPIHMYLFHGGTKTL